MDEFKLINWIKQFNNEAIGDDTAVLSVSEGKDLLATADMLVEGTHFLTGKISPFQLGHKTLAVNLSDIAAMGGSPKHIILSCCWSKSYQEEDVKEFFRGLFSLADRYNVKLAGGDTCGGEKITLDLCLLGEVEKGKEVKRSTAKEGDYIVVTGPLGTSGAGLEIVLNDNNNYNQICINDDINDGINCGINDNKVNSLNKEEKDLLLNAHLVPEPRVNEGKKLGELELVNSMIDVSDGLSSEVYHLAGCSDKGAIIYESKIPILEPVKKLGENLGKDPVEWALTGGEDYQLLMTVNEKNLDKVLETVENLKKTSHNYSQYFSQFGSPEVIGKIVAKRDGVKIEKNNIKYELDSRGYTHF
ncbi:Thiamine-monophosphate kinase [Natranaerofaba carboxydovora]|nr:Thiamine-monophosphate kinase [Natranaerofaba carboxydovora]